MDKMKIKYTLRVFGCKAYAYINKTKRKKLDDRTLKAYLSIMTTAQRVTEFAQKMEE